MKKTKIIILFSIFLILSCSFTFNRSYNLKLSKTYYFLQSFPENTIKIDLLFLYDDGTYLYKECLLFENNTQCDSISGIWKNINNEKIVLTTNSYLNTPDSLMQFARILSVENSFYSWQTELYIKDGDKLCLTNENDKRFYWYPVLAP